MSYKCVSALATSYRTSGCHFKGLDLCGLQNIWNFQEIGLQNLSSDSLLNHNLVCGIFTIATAVYKVYDRQYFAWSLNWVLNKSPSKIYFKCGSSVCVKCYCVCKLPHHIVVHGNLLQAHELGTKVTNYLLTHEKLMKQICCTVCDCLHLTCTISVIEVRELIPIMAQYIMVEILLQIG